MKFQMLIFYKTDKGLKNYLDRFPQLDYKKCIVHQERNYVRISTDHIEITCLRILNEHCRGNKVHFIAVEEDHTWRNDWKRIKDTILQPSLLSPIPIHIFDSISYLDAEELEAKRNPLS